MGGESFEDERVEDDNKVLGSSEAGTGVAGECESKRRCEKLTHFHTRRLLHLPRRLLGPPSARAIISSAALQVAECNRIWRE